MLLRQWRRGRWRSDSRLYIAQCDVGAHALHTVVQSIVKTATSEGGRCSFNPSSLVGSCTAFLRIIQSTPKRGKMLPSPHMLEGVTPWSRIFFPLSSSVASLSPADNVSRPLPYRMRRLHQPVMSPPNGFSIPRSTLLSS